MADRQKRPSRRPAARAGGRPGNGTRQLRRSGHARQQKPARQSGPGRQSKPKHDRAFKRNRGRSRSASITAGIFILAALIYIAQSVYLFFKKPHIATEPVEIGSVALPETMQGIIIRDEVVYTAGRDGHVEFNVNEYDRVKAGTAICEIQNTEAMAEITLEKEIIEEEIIAYQAMREGISNIDPAVSRLNEQLANTVESNLYSFTSHDISGIYALREDIKQMADTRDRMIIAENANVRKELGAEHAQLLTRLEENTSTISTLQSGLMTSVVDGKEGELTLENMKDLTREKVAEKVDYNNIILKRDVKTDDPVFKIVTSNNWYIGAYIPNELVEGYAVDKRCVMYLEDPAGEGEYVPVNLVVEFITQNYNDSYVLFRCNKNIIDYLNMRNINIRTSDSVRTGFKISNTAITSKKYLQIPLEYIAKSDDKGDYILASSAGEGLVRTPVAIFDEDENFAYVREGAGGIASGTQISLEGLPLYTIAPAIDVPGVYRAIGGYYEFVRITLDEPGTDNEGSAETGVGGGYTLLDPAFNHGLKSYDYIVVNAADITEEI